LIGAGSDLSLYHNGTDSYIDEVSGGSLRIASDSLTLETITEVAGAREYYLNAVAGSGVQMYADGKLRLKTTSAANGGGFSGGIEVVNEHVDNPATIKIIQDTKVFTITTGLSGNPELKTTGGVISLKSDSGVAFKNENGSQTSATFGSSHYFYPMNQAGTSRVSGFTVLQSTDATSAGTLCRVYGDLQVDGQIIHGGGGGIFNGDQTITTTAPTQLAFTLNRATTGTLIFDVWFTSETSVNTSVAKKYTVAHANNATPVYNKIIDTGPGAGNSNTDDFTVSFVNAGSGLSVECYILGVGVATQNIGYTVQVGHDSANALTFTAAS
jgi:hypothetical protein